MSDGKVTIDVDVSSEELQELIAKLKKVDDNARQSTVGLKNMAGSVVVANLVSNAISKINGALQELGAEALSSSDQLDKIGSTLEFAGKTQAEIDSVKKSVKSYADQTVYDLGEVANVTSQLGASGVKDYAKLTQAMGNLNSVAGGNRDTFSSVGMVMTQTAGAGKLTTENWNQMANAIPGATGILQDELKKTGAYTGNFRDAMAKGQITAEEFNAAIMKVGFSDVAQESATAVTTFEGAFASMQSVVVDKLMEVIDLIGKDTITTAITSMGDGIAIAFDLIIAAFTEIKTIYEEHKTLIDSVIVVLVALGAAYVAFNATVTAISIVSKITQLGGALTKVFAIMAANPIALVVAALVGFGIALYKLYQSNEEFRTKVQAIWNTISNFITPLVKILGDFITKVWTDVMTWWNENNEQIKASALIAWNFIKDTISAVLNALAPYIKAVWEGIKTATSFVWNAIKAVVTTVITVIQEVIMAITSAIQGDWDSVWTSIGSILSTIINGMVEVVEGVLGGMISIVAGIVQGVLDAFNPLFNFDLSGAGRAIINGFLGGLRSAWNAGKNFISGIAGWIKDHKGPISYDKRLLIPAGKAIMGGFDKSLQNSFSNVQDTVSGMAGRVKDGFNTQLNGSFSGIKLPNLNTNNLMSSRVSIPQAEQVTQVETIVELDGKAIGRGTAKFVKRENDRVGRFEARQKGVFA